MLPNCFRVNLLILGKPRGCKHKLGRDKYIPQDVVRWIFPALEKWKSYSTNRTVCFSSVTEEGKNPYKIRDDYLFLLIPHLYAVWLKSQFWCHIHRIKYNIPQFKECKQIALRSWLCSFFLTGMDLSHMSSYIDFACKGCRSCVLERKGRILMMAKGKISHPCFIYT